MDRNGLAVKRRACVAQYCLQHSMCGLIISMDVPAQRYLSTLKLGHNQPTLEQCLKM